MKTLWVVVANSSNAKIFCVNGIGKEIKKVHDLDHPESRQKGSDLVSDRPGRAYDRVGAGRHAVGRNPLVHEHQVFAQEVCELLRKGFDEGAFENVALIASPDFLGEIRLSLTDQVKTRVVNSIDKDIASVDDKECVDLMCRYLDLWNR